MTNLLNNRFELQELIGSGGSGRVHKAYDLHEQRVVAIKFLDKVFHNDKDLLLRFRNEAKLLEKLSHPNTVRVYQFVEAVEDGEPFLVMEFVNGGSLAGQLSDGGVLPAKEAAFLTEQIALALHQAHTLEEKGIIHRDVKPGNILIAEDGTRVTPKLTDFGLARSLVLSEQYTTTGRIMGTPPYLSPEQVNGVNEDYGPPTDVYCLGATLYRTLVGKPPFEMPAAKRPVTETLHAIERLEPVTPRSINKQIPRDLETICLKCLQKSTFRRYQTALALAEDLQRFQKGEPIHARRDPFWLRLVRLYWSRPTAAWSITILAITLIAVTGLLLLSEHFRSIAEQQTILANQARLEADTRRLEQMIQSGNIAANAGRWAEAQRIYNDVLKDERLDDEQRHHLLLRLVRSGQILNDRVLVERCLAQLGTKKLSKQHAALLTFEEAVQQIYLGTVVADKQNLFTSPQNAEETKALALLAKVVNDPESDPADRETARGLMATNAADAMRAYRLALDKSPFHPYALIYQSLTCMMAGEFNEALQTTEVWLRATPDDPLPWLYKAMTLSLQGHHADAASTLKRANTPDMGNRVFSKETLQGFERLVSTLKILDESLQDTSTGVLGTLKAMGNFPVMNNLFQAFNAKPKNDPAIFTVPVPPHMRLAMGTVFRAIDVSFIQGNPKAGLPLLNEPAPFIPLGLHHFIRMCIASKLTKSRDPVEVNNFNAMGIEETRKAAATQSYWHLREISLAGYARIGASAWQSSSKWRLFRIQQTSFLSFVMPAGSPSHIACIDVIGSSVIIKVNDEERYNRDARMSLWQAASSSGLTSALKGKLKEIAKLLNDARFSADIDQVLAGDKK